MADRTARAISGDLDLNRMSASHQLERERGSCEPSRSPHGSQHHGRHSSAFGAQLKAARTGWGEPLFNPADDDGSERSGVDDLLRGIQALFTCSTNDEESFQHYASSLEGRWVQGLVTIDPCRGSALEGVGRDELSCDRHASGAEGTGQDREG